MVVGGSTRALRGRLPSGSGRLRRGARVRLVGKRVVLRPPRPEDADVIAQGFVDDPTMGVMLGMEPENENAEWLRDSVVDKTPDGEEPKSYWFAMADPESDEPLGEIGLIGISWPN